MGIGAGTQGGGINPGGGVTGGGYTSSSGGTRTDTIARPGAIAAQLTALSEAERSKLKLRCRDIAANAMSYDSGLVQLCRILRGS
ncbi:hypothetical protein [Phyllobacterium lublinensis]|uniref:hypothetical protein n=1 Tax=Phyllobacterium lublinensis TaxID=2875708 RepID=UPI001CCEA21C|nr:hypothetical protein [Phyllobacterium sp. 2063]MBZ9655199.1 hypothetical protein [Phyllobacterium sp. 2063]